MVILITGASNGIGKYLSNHFASKGFPVYGTFNLTETKNQPGITMCKVDVSDYKQVEGWIQSLPLADKKIVLINSAGIAYNAFAHKADPEKWLEVLKVNLLGSFNTIRAALPVMRAAGYGRIINISSVVAHSGVPGTSAYAASKAALWGLSKSIAVENATKGITVNSLDLGYFNIGMIKSVPEEIQKEIMKKIPVQTFGDPKNIIGAVEFLMGSDYTTGENLNINGGLY